MNSHLLPGATALNIDWRVEYAKCGPIASLTCDVCRRGSHGHAIKMPPEFSIDGVAIPDNMGMALLLLGIFMANPIVLLRLS